MDNKNHRAVKYILRRMTHETRKLYHSQNCIGIYNVLNICKKTLYYLGVCFYWDDASQKWKEERA